MEEQIEFDYYGVNVLVIGDWAKGYSGDQEEPGEPKGFEDYEILIGDEVVTDLLKNSVVDDILEKAINKLSAYPDYVD